MAGQDGFRGEVESGDRRRALEAVRGLLVDSIERCDPDNRAPLVKQLREVIAELEALAVPEVSASDEIAQLRAARRAAGVPDAPGEGVQRGRSRRGAG